MNIFKSLEKENEKGNKYILFNGNIVSETSVTSAIRKEYLANIKTDSKLADISLSDYVKTKLESIPTVKHLLEYAEGYVKKMFTHFDGEVQESEAETSEDNKAEVMECDVAEVEETK